MKSVAERYSYPTEIDSVIGRFIACCQQTFGVNKLGILLVGSAARGELSWSNEDKRLRFYSDIEFLVVVEKKTSRQSSDFTDAIERLNTEIDLGERFKIDFVVNTWKGMQKVEKRIFAFDSKNTGIELGSVDVRPFLPDVDRATLNFYELNDVLLHRMKALLTDVPLEIFDGGGNLDDFRLAIAKNALDITTWLYPYEAEKLVSGFENRLDGWDNNDKTLVLSEYFGQEEFGFLRECIAIRRFEREDYDLVDMLRRYIAIYERAIAYCKAMNKIESQRCLTEPAVSKTLFWEYSVRRRLKEAYLLSRNYRVFGARNFFRNILMPRKGRQIDFCYSMLKALSFYLSQRPEQFEMQLEKSKASLSMIRSITDSPERLPVERWLDLREQYTAINKVLI